MSLCVTITCARRQTGRSYKVLLGIVLLLGWTSNVDLNPKYTMVEYFAGKAHVSNVFNNSPGHRVASYEINDSRSMDFLSAPGFVFLISIMQVTHVNDMHQGYWVWISHTIPSSTPFAVLRLAIVLALQSCAGALHLMAPVCGSWTRISRGSSLRSSINCFGDMTREFVATANCMISRPIHLISFPYQFGIWTYAYIGLYLIS